MYSAWTNNISVKTQFCTQQAGSQWANGIHDPISLLSKQVSPLGTQWKDRDFDATLTSAESPDFH